VTSLILVWHLTIMGAAGGITFGKAYPSYSEVHGGGP
jgi:hypothetical protein